MGVFLFPFFIPFSRGVFYGVCSGVFSVFFFILGKEGKDEKDGAREGRMESFYFFVAILFMNRM